MKKLCKIKGFSDFVPLFRLKVDFLYKLNLYLSFKGKKKNKKEKYIVIE